MKTFFLTGVLVFLLFLVAGAQDSSAAHVWTLQECLDYAKNNNIQVNAAGLNQRISSEQYLQSQAAVLPDLYGSGSQSANHIGKNISGRNFTLNGGVGFNSSVTLYNGGYLRNDIKQKNLLVESANLSILENINDVTLQVTRSFLTVLLDKESIIYAADLLNTSKAQVQQSEQLYSAGSVARKDLIQTKAQLAQDQYNLTSAINAERNDKITLKQLLQVTDTAFDIAKPDTIINSSITVPLEATQRIALDNRPEVKNAALNVQVSELGLKKAAAGYKPTLSAGASIGTNYGNDPTYVFIRQFDNNFYQQVGLTLSVPIFTKRVVKTNVNIAKIGIEQSQLDLKNTRTTLALDVERAYVNVQNAQGQYDAAVNQLDATREVYSIAGEELRLGATNMVEYILQRNQYIQALQNYLQAKYNAALAVRIYDFYQGLPITLQ